MEQYNILGRTGEGAHGIVFKAKHIEVTDWCFYVCILPHFFPPFLCVIRSALNLESNLSGLEMWHGNALVCQTGETVALKKVALRRLEDGIPNQALREIKALQEIKDNEHVSECAESFYR